MHFESISEKTTKHANIRTHYKRDKLDLCMTCGLHNQVHDLWPLRPGVKVNAT